MRPRPSLGRACLVLALVSSCDKPEPQTRAPVDAAAESQRRLRVTGFVRALERERYYVPLADDVLSRGASDPLVTIVVFVDYAAPDPRVEEQLERLLAAHPDDLRVAVLQHPSNNASLAAQAVLAAHAQGFGWPMHSRLLAQPDALRADDLRRLAAELGIPDLVGFDRHMTVAGAMQLRADVQEAQRLDITRRPTLFVNGVALVGAKAADELAGVVDAELATAERLLALGARRDEIYPELMRRAAHDRSEPPGPVEIPWEPEYAVAALSTAQLEHGVVVDEVALGEGAAVVEGQLVEFEFRGYAGVTGKQVMGSREKPAQMVLNEATRTRDPIAAAMADAMLGMRVGGKRRIKIPAAIVEADKPEGRPPVGDLWLAVEIVDVREAPKLESLDAFAGKPIASKRDADGLEIYDYRKGTGPKAKAGMTVTTHYVGQLLDGTEFDSSHGRAEGLKVALGDSPGVLVGFARGLEGARVGMLRKIVIPPELAYASLERGKIPANSTLVFYLQITDVQPTPAED